jgi:endoglucanase
MFKNRRGTNISHWLCQSDRRGDDRRKYFTEVDVQRIAEWGFDHIRLPVDEVQLWDEAGRQDSEAFDLLDHALDWALGAGLAVVVDLHILRSHFFTLSAEQKLFTEPAEAEKFADLWKQLSSRLIGRETSKVAYELLNEAVATDPDDWNRVARGAFQAIRSREPERKIVLGSNHFNSVRTFDRLQVPDDKNTILTFHFYHPMLVTHHRAGWSPEGKLYSGKIQYPGEPVPLDVLATLDDSLQKQLAGLNQNYNRDSMLADLEKPLAVARCSGLPLYCGEFGVIHLAPQIVREAWYRDLISVLEENQIGWANWDYKGQFGILDSKGNSTGVAEAMFSAVR